LIGGTERAVEQDEVVRHREKMTAQRFSGNRCQILTIYPHWI
jgi:hypothetical protein